MVVPRSASRGAELIPRPIPQFGDSGDRYTIGGPLFSLLQPAGHPSSASKSKARFTVRCDARHSGSVRLRQYCCLAIGTRGSYVNGVVGKTQ
jgi:hypothetical protein